MNSQPSPLPRSRRARPRRASLTLPAAALTLLTLLATPAHAADITCQPGSSFNMPCAGTDADDTITGTDGPDIIAGFGGNDTINALGGDDFVDAGSGDDFVDAGSGRNTIDGGPGTDACVFALTQNCEDTNPTPLF